MTLSSRISSLTGPDRAVDAEVAVALGWRLHTFNCNNINGSTEQGELWIPPYFTEEDVKSAEGEYRSMAAVNAWPESEPPAFTASLDAAMSVVPNEWRCGFEQAGRFDESDVVEAWCWPFESSFEPDWRNGDEGYRGAPDACRATAPTPALALLAAAMQARGL